MNYEQRTATRGARSENVISLADLGPSVGILALALLLGGCGGSEGGEGPGRSLGSGSNCQEGSVQAELVSVPGGSFFMGCNSSVDNQCKPDEIPGRTVTLQAFQIDRFEVTQAQYSACVAAGDCELPTCDWDCSRADYPAGCVGWAAAKAYCAWAGKRLPSEAEWEKAARGSDGRKYPWGNSEPTCSQVNMSGCNGAATSVGSLSEGASPYGALDMAGNMVEMTNDWYSSSYYASAPANDPKGPANGTRYVGRGGGWKSEATWQRTSVRDWYVATDAGQSLGFRCAK